MSRVFHRHLRQHYPTALQGDGVYLIDSDGRRYLDASGGAAVSCLGHSNRRVRDRIASQLDRLAYAHTSFFTTEPMERLADFLIDRAPEGLESVYFVSGGSEAMEAALKLARQYFVEIGQPQRRHVIARRQSYHGNTLGALATGGNAWRRAPFEPLLPAFHHVSPCYAYRGRRDGETLSDYGRRLVDELDQTIESLGPDQVMAFVAEPVVGATLGAVPAVDGYFEGVRQVCDRHGVLLILDEVMCGMGRTGHRFACEHDRVAPDLLCIAKGLGAGYQPIGATLVSGAIHGAIRDGSGFFQHGHTYIGHALACTAALAVQEVIEADGLLERVRTQGDRLMRRLGEVFADHPHVGDLRGRGLFVGLELVANRSTRDPFPAREARHARVRTAAMAEGLMVYPMGGTVDGQSGDHVLLAPPFIIDDDQVEELVVKLERSLRTALQQEPH